MALLFDQPFQILLDLARDDKIDPWDVDIEKLADVYLSRLLETEELNLRVSGRAIHSASVLLHMKSQNPPYNGRPKKQEDELSENVTLGLPELGPLTVIRRSPRKITLSELVGSLQRTLKEPSRKKSSKKSQVEKIVRSLDEFHLNIEKKLDEFYERIVSLTSKDQRLGLSQLLLKRSKKEMVRNLMLALFLCKRGKISLHQEDHFEEIYIQLEGKTGGESGD